VLAQVSRKIQKLEQKRVELTKILRCHSPDDLLQKPSEHVWSPLEISHHLYISEYLSRQYLKKKIKAKDNLKRTGITSFFRLQLLKIALSSPLKFKAPVPIAIQPKNLSIELLEEWENERQHLIKFLDDIDEDLVLLELFRHPFAGRMNILQMLDFLEAHFDHHKTQILRRLPANPKI